MAPPIKPAAPAVTTRTPDSLTADWPSVAGVSYVVRARDVTGLVREIAVAVAPAKVDGLAANEQYSITLEAVNSDGGSGESAATADWTALPEPQTPAVVYASARDGVVSIGWDLTAEVAPVHHPETISIEAARSDAANPAPQVVGTGKIRDLRLDWRAPIGPLQYRLRLRAGRPPPQAAAFSAWGAAVLLTKPMPTGSGQHAPTKIDGVSRPLVGGQSSLALALAKDEEAAKEDGDEDGDSNGDSDSKPNSGNNNSAGPGPGGQNADPPASKPSGGDGDPSDGKADRQSGRPSDDDKVDESHVRAAVETINTDHGPMIRVEVMGGYESRKTEEGLWERHVADRGDGHHDAIGNWELRGPETKDSDRTGAGPAKDGSSLPVGRSYFRIPKSSSQEADSAHHEANAGAAQRPENATSSASAQDEAGEGARGRARAGSWEDADRFYRSDFERRNANPGMTLRSDRGDMKRATPDNMPSERPSAPARDVSPRSRSPRGGAAAPGLTDRFMNFLRSFWSSPPSGQGSATRPSRGGGPGKLATGTPETNAAIQDAASRYGFDVNFMRAVASIESGMRPTIVNKLGYSGLYQFGGKAWKDFGQGGDRLNARENAMAAARMFDKNKQLLEKHFGRPPTPTELYIAHQQGAGFYLNGANSKFMRGNPYPGMKGEQTQQSFQTGWGAEIERRMRYFDSLNRGAPSQPLPLDRGGPNQPPPLDQPLRMP